MEDTTNSDRVRWAKNTLLAYAILKEDGDDLYDELDMVLMDLLSDLMHLADAMCIDFDDRLRCAKHHYLCESGVIEDW